MHLWNASKRERSESVRQGLIVLIPKPEKDFLYLENWRPISLINSDYKLFASLYAKRFKLCLNETISPSQSGFMKKRHISNKIYETILI